jgi:hypothetical protein
MFRNGQDSDGDVVKENSNNRERAESRVSAYPNHSVTSKALLSSVALDSKTQIEETLQETDGQAQCCQ